MPACNEHSRTISEVMGRHVVVAEAGGHVHALVRFAAELAEHVFEGPEAWLVRFRIFGGEDVRERRTEFRDVFMNLGIVGVREDHQRDFPGHLR
jgi:hypothetical protein